jgi:hypothetical protein
MRLLFEYPMFFKPGGIGGTLNHSFDTGFAFVASNSVPLARAAKTDWTMGLHKVPGVGEQLESRPGHDNSPDPASIPHTAENLDTFCMYRGPHGREICAGTAVHGNDHNGHHAHGATRN